MRMMTKYESFIFLKKLHAGIFPGMLFSVRYLFRMSLHTLCHVEHRGG